MAKISNYLILVAFFLATTNISAISSATKEESAYRCARHVGSYCGKQLYHKLFQDKPLTLECCYKLVQMGRSCNAKMVKDFLQTNPDPRGRNWTQVLSESDEIFYKCDQVTKPAEAHLLGMCREKIGSHCGKVVFEKLVRPKKTVIISKYCCEKLVGMGQSCHVNLVKDLLRTSFEFRSANATEVLERSKKMYYQCQKGSATIDS